MRRTYILKYLQIIFFIIIGTVNFLNAIKTGSLADWIIYAVCMVGIIVVAFSIKKLRDEEKSIADGKSDRKVKMK